ncbi:hypothetical protein FA15DRAFT_661768 [Coprinopsis marcescibilis]|uniref:Uncharacterized protein n=1 Tax=Coprinopsis marcescibilis TaxID=230819 RepID=A0A5C3KAR9_COPMA|nr:hypothetical protein FA15DRAFT_661768 [Coprinopsis marcescibilis]
MACTLLNPYSTWGEPLRKGFQELKEPFRALANLLVQQETSRLSKFTCVSIPAEPTQPVLLGNPIILRGPTEAELTLLNIPVASNIDKLTHGDIEQAPAQLGDKQSADIYIQQPMENRDPLDFKLLSHLQEQVDKTLLVDEDLLSDMNLYLQQLGKEITGAHFMQFLQRAEVKEKYSITWDIS